MIVSATLCKWSQLPSLSESRNVIFFSTAIFAALLLDAVQLSLALLGMLAYTVLQPGVKKSRLSTVVRSCHASSGWSNAKPINRNLPNRISACAKQGRSHSSKDDGAIRRPSFAPVIAPNLSSVEWEAQVLELLSQIHPTREGDAVVHALSSSIAACIRSLLPGASVTGFAGSNLQRNQSLATAVPEVDIVASYDCRALSQCLPMRSPPAASVDSEETEIRRLHNAAIRKCTKQLVAAGFKFRRSAFVGVEPKVTLLAPHPNGGTGIPITFSVNAAIPFRNAALLAHCSKVEPTTKLLVQLVKRWAKDRGLCHAAKGHFPLYVWTILTVFFLQTGTNDNSLLPPLNDLDMVMSEGDAYTTDFSVVQSSAKDGRSVGKLFQQFMRFYTHCFQWRTECVSLRCGHRGHARTDFVSATGLSVEDPWDEKRNLASSMTTEAASRLFEEFARADKFCCDGCSLAELYEPWSLDEDSSEKSRPGSGQEDVHAPSIA